jgi:hypothetical protein
MEVLVFELNTKCIIAYPKADSSFVMATGPGKPSWP